MNQVITILDASAVLFPRNADGTYGAGIETGEGTLASATIELSLDTKTYADRRGRQLASISKQPSGRLNATTVNVAAANVARALNGVLVKVEAGSKSQDIELPAGGGIFFIDAVKASNVVVKQGSTVIDPSKYDANLENGRITFAADVPAGTTSVTYDVAEHYEVGLLTAPAKEFLVRFEGVDLDTGNPVVTTLYRVKLEPSKNFALVSDDFVQLDLSGAVLADLTKAADAELGQYGTYRALR